VSAITVNPVTGRLTTDAATIERLKALAASDGAMLASGDVRTTRNDHPRKPQVVHVDPPPGDAEIEALLGGLMVTVYVEAMKSFDEARKATAVGQLVELRDIHINQGARLVRAFAELVEARARRRGMVVEHRHQHLHRRVP
jgi:hypothetical protein